MRSSALIISMSNWLYILVVQINLRFFSKRQSVLLFYCTNKLSMLQIAILAIPFRSYLMCVLETVWSEIKEKLGQIVINALRQGQNYMNSLLISVCIIKKKRVRTLNVQKMYVLDAEQQDRGDWKAPLYCKNIFLHLPAP